MKARLGEDIIRCVGYGHIGDGNMHLNITSKHYDQEVMDKIEPYLYQWTNENKGSISAEHGKYIHKEKYCTSRTLTEVKCILISQEKGVLM